MIDTDAELIAGRAAAGFHLGQQYTEHLFGEPITLWSPASGISLSQATLATPAWLRVDVADLTEARFQGTEFVYGHGMVKLRFDACGILYEVVVGAGYTGLAWDSIGVGARLASVRQRCEVIYDATDEMHYPGDRASVGIAFLAEEMPLDNAPDQVIAAISIHDWDLRAPFY